MLVILGFLRGPLAGGCELTQQVQVPQPYFEATIDLRGPFVFFAFAGQPDYGRESLLHGVVALVIFWLQFYQLAPSQFLIAIVSLHRGLSSSQRPSSD